MEGIHLKAKRDVFLDFMRGIAIFFVLWGHSIQYLACNDIFLDNLVFKAIYSFHMPLFMFLSGYTFYWSCKKRKLKYVLSSRLKGIAIPMLVWGIISFVLSLRNEIPNSLLSIVKSIVSNCLEIWFLWAVLVSSVFVAVIYKSGIRMKTLKYSLMILSMVFIAILPRKNNILFVYPYFIIGFVFSENNVFSLDTYRKIEPIFLLIWLCLIPFYKRQHYIYTSGILPCGSEYGFWVQMGIDTYRYVVGLAGVLAVVFIARLLYDRFREKKVMKLMEYAGIHSLDIYVMQRLLLEGLIAQTWPNVFGGYDFQSMTIDSPFYCVITTVCAVVCLIVLCFVSRQIEKSEMLSFVLFGKKKSKYIKN